MEMHDLRNQLSGVWLPLVTPLRDGALDEISLRRLVRHYATDAIDGFILAATSGEGLLLETSELEHLVVSVRAELAEIPRILPICLGLAGASTARMKEMLDETAAWPIDGYLISAPYYLRPSQRGLLTHFNDLADHASWPIMLYNIPYRSSVNLANDTLLKLAAASEHRRHEGLLRGPRADDRPAEAAAGRLPRADRRGRAIFRCARRRR
jgi:4-hydroxy-tetrahydrodipicolinate synthase